MTYINTFQRPGGHEFTFDRTGNTAQQFNEKGDVIGKFTYDKADNTWTSANGKRSFQTNGQHGRIASGIKDNTINGGQSGLTRLGGHWA